MVHKEFAHILEVKWFLIMIIFNICDELMVHYEMFNFIFRSAYNQEKSCMHMKGMEDQRNWLGA